MILTAVKATDARMNINLTKTDKATLIGLYIAKFDRAALVELGFSGMWEAFNVIGYSLGCSPASIKNYRDEFDRLFPGNPRRGWQRQLKTRSKNIYESFGELDFENFTFLVKSFLIPHFKEEQAVASVVKREKGDTVAKRLITGKAAEEYFKANYTTVLDFEQHEISDTTILACGFDFKLTKGNGFYCVEVKGINQSRGNISFTKNEFDVASDLRQRYCLFIVTNFAERPNHQLFFDPVHCGLNFSKIERTVIQTSYSLFV